MKTKQTATKRPMQLVQRQAMRVARVRPMALDREGSTIDLCEAVLPEDCRAMLLVRLGTEPEDLAPWLASLAKWLTKDAEGFIEIVGRMLRMKDEEAERGRQAIKGAA